MQRSMWRVYLGTPLFSPKSCTLATSTATTVFGSKPPRNITGAVKL